MGTRSFVQLHPTTVDPVATKEYTRGHRARITFRALPYRVIADPANYQSPEIVAYTLSWEIRAEIFH